MRDSRNHGHRRPEKQCRRMAVRVSVLIGLFGSLQYSALALAQDRVTFTPPGASGPVTALGEVVDYTGRELVLQTLNGPQHIASDSVVSIETPYDPAMQRAMAEFQQGQTSAALASFREALGREHRPWAQREIRSWLMKCALRQQDLSGALREFREIALADPQSRFWGIAPLIWSPMSISPAIRSEVQPWLKSPRESERMLAASILLLDPISGEAAEEVFQQLARDTNPILSAYSKAQQWRLTIGSRNVSEIVLTNWQSEIQRLRPELRSGPQYLLARGYEVRGELRRAAAEALWLPFVYPDNEPLAARALLDAAEALGRAGLSPESNSLKQELAVRYPWSREASIIRSEQKQSPPQ